MCDSGATPPWVRVGSRDPLGLEMPLDAPLGDQIGEFSPVEIREMDYRNHPVEDDDWVEDSSPTHSYAE